VGNPRRTVCSCHHKCGIYAIPHRRTMGCSPHAGLEMLPAASFCRPFPALKPATKLSVAIPSIGPYGAAESRGQCASCQN
jgi:hypothetical protein